MAVFSCLVNLVAEPFDSDAAYDVKIGTLSSWSQNAAFGWYLSCFVIVPISHYILAMSSRTRAPLPLIMSSTYAAALWIASSGDVWPARSFLIISIAGGFLVMTLRYTISDYPQNLAVDCMTMRCLTHPPRACDSDVASPSATLNDDSMEVDIAIPSACEKIG